MTLETRACPAVPVASALTMADVIRVHGVAFLEALGGRPDGGATAGAGGPGAVPY